MKTSKSIAISSCITIGVIIVLICLVKWNERVGSLFFGGEDTVYASGYSESRFWSIKHGMSSNQVVELIGSPLSVVQQDENYQSPETEWIYSASSPTNRTGNFIDRTVVFDARGFVLRKETSLYVD